MKKLGLLLVSLLIMSSSCQEKEELCICKIVDIPDDIFLAWLINEGVDKNNDGHISTTEAEAIRYLDISDGDDDQISLQNVVELTGIKAFNNLDTLRVSWIPIHTLDISNLNKLRFFDIKWTYVNDLNISGCTGLKYLNISDIGNDRLDISDCINLETLVIRNVEQPIEVCVWTLPFPPNGMEASIIDEDVTFTTDCSK